MDQSFQPQETVAVMPYVGAAQKTEAELSPAANQVAQKGSLVQVDAALQRVWCGHHVFGFEVQRVSFLEADVRASEAVSSKGTP
jgi:hypothetical protein